MRFNDLAFGVHAWIMCVVVYSQFYPRLWGWKKSAGVRRHVNKISLGLIWGSLLAVGITVAIVFASGNSGSSSDGRGWGWIDVVSLTKIAKYQKYLMRLINRFRSTPFPTSSSSSQFSSTYLKSSPTISVNQQSAGASLNNFWILPAVC